MSHEFLHYCRSRGLSIRLTSGKIMISPASNLLASDAEWVRANRDQVISALQDELDELDNQEIESAVVTIEGRIGRRLP